MEYGKELLDLAGKFIQAEACAGHTRWAAAELAHEMRAKFPKRGKAEQGWENFCRKELQREPGTISEYVRAVEYCLKHVNNFKNRGTFEVYPPVSLVALLAGVRPEQRSELHEKLFSGAYSANEFRDLLRGVQAPPGASSPADRKKRPAKPGTRQKGDPGKPKPQRIETAKLPGLFPEQKDVLAFQAGNWVSVTELNDNLNGILLANEKKLTAWTIVVIPPKGASVIEKVSGQEGGDDE